MNDFVKRLEAALGSAYRIEKELGGGGMSRVFLAEETQLGRQVVVKILPPELAQGVNAERFRREIRLAASLQHPHVVPLLNAGQADDLFWYTMPFIEGESLRARLEREGELPVSVVTKLLRDVTDALAYAHERGIVHRDIKPDNILLTGSHAVVTDFGVAKAIASATGESSLTSVGVALGTPAYMAPEQAAADPHTDHRADLYAVGALAYEMLTGAPPFEGLPQAVLAAHVTQAPEPVTQRRPAVPPPIATLVMRCLEKKPADRYQTAGELLAEIERFATPTQGTIPTTAVTLAVPGRRRLLSVAAAAVVVVVGALLLTTQLGRSQPNVIASAQRMAVVPFVPTTADTALARLGRDLVVTLTANLEGVGDIRMVDALSVLAKAQEATMSLDDGAALAQALGASSFVHGTLVRVSNGIRLDLGLFTADAQQSIARATVTTESEDLEALTDSTTWALLRQVWRTREPPTPSLSAVTTRSLPALRAFIEGEQAIARSDWELASEAFARAIDADSTFWLAYYRLQYTRNWIFLPLDERIVETVRARRAGFPERDRLLAEGRADVLVDRFPEYWPGWMAYGDDLVHWGGYNGHLPAEAIAALERVIELNPTFLPAWEHLHWVAATALDTARVRTTWAALTRLEYSPVLEYGLDFRFFTQVTTELSLGGLTYEPEPARLDSLARGMAVSRGPLTEFTYHWFSNSGYNAVQIDLNRRVLALVGSGRQAGLILRTLPFFWAGRGAWDSSMVAADRYVTAAPGSQSALEAYELALAGWWLGMLPRAEADRRRAVAARAVEGESDVLAWLDGFAAYVDGDVGRIGTAREALSRDSELAAPLRALELAAQGRPVIAADTLIGKEAELHMQEAPLARGIARIEAAKWLLAAGDTSRAVRLLRFPLSGPTNSAALLRSPPLAPYALMELARIAAAQGDKELARAHYRQFLVRYDMPPPAHQAWVEEARAAQ